MVGLRVPPAEGITSTHPGYVATNNANVVFLESFVHGVPDQSTPDDDSARGFVVDHLGKLSSVDVDSLRRRESWIRILATKSWRSWALMLQAWWGRKRGMNQTVFEAVVCYKAEQTESNPNREGLHHALQLGHSFVALPSLIPGTLRSG